MPQRNTSGHDQERVRNEASETTPLIPPPPTTVDASPEARLDEATTNPSSSSSTAGGGSGVNNSKPNGKPANVDDDGHTLANQTISVARGILCTLALGFLIFLQATNISLITTTQSRIAADLDAFDKTSWFTSAYLIAMSALGPLNGKLSSVFSPRICIFASTIVLAIGSVLS
ncbi:hypothetical protein KC318_g15966, partial [Hortaea werneckii]